MSIADDESLLQDYVAECREHLASLEPDLLMMERDGTAVEQEVINRAFRAVHSIKGAAGFFGLNNIRNLSHHMEDILKLLRDRTVVPDTDLVDVLLSASDKLRALVDDVENSESISCDKEMEALSKLASGMGQEVPAGAGGEPAGEAGGAGVQVPAVGTAAPEADVFEVSRVEMASALSTGQKLYMVRVGIASDIGDRDRTPTGFLDNVAPYGSLLSCRLDLSTCSTLETCLTSNPVFVMLLATVLEQDLAALALGLPVDSLVELDRDRLKSTVTTRDGMDRDTILISSALAAGVEGEKAGGKESELVGTDEEAPPTKVEAAREAGVSTRWESGDTIRVKVDLLDRLVELAGELVLARNRLNQITVSEKDESPELAGAIQDVDVVGSALQSGIMQTRMQPVGNLFDRLPRLVRTLSRSMSKQVQVSMSGGEVELDRHILEKLYDPLAHIVSNSVTHGIGSAEERKAAGKSPVGKIVVGAFHEGGHVNIIVTDDGRGIDVQEVYWRAVAAGKVNDAVQGEMSDREKLELIFLPGVSTAEELTDTAGRGVGMDVVKTNIEALGGHIELESAPEEGTTILITVPLTLAVIPSLIVGLADGRRFAVAQVGVVELHRVRAAEVHTSIQRVAGAEVLRLRGALLPLVRLTDALGLEPVFVHPETGEVASDRRRRLADRRNHVEGPSLRPFDFAQDKLRSEPSASPRAEGPADEQSEGEEREEKRKAEERRKSFANDVIVIVLRAGVHRYGLVVDEVFDLQEIVVKPLSSYIKDVECFSGVTIMGDGHVVLILGTEGIAAHCGLNFEEKESQKRHLAGTAGQPDGYETAVPSRRTKSVLVFNYGKDECFAVPLESVSRLERFETEALERMGEREVAVRGEGFLPLVRLDNILPVSSFPEGKRVGVLIIPRRYDVGIAASEIVDAVETDAELSDCDASMPEEKGVAGSAVVGGRLTVFLDVDKLVAADTGLRANSSRRPAS